MNPDITVVSGKTPYSYQTSIGVQRQMTTTMSFQADYVWTGGRREDVSNQINLSYDPATGANFRYSDLSKRPFPELGRVSLRNMSGRSNYHGLEAGLTKRFSDRWQASATYTLSGSWNDSPPVPLIPGCAYPMNGLTMTCDKPLTVAVDLGGEYGLGATINSLDQRHRAVFNGSGPRRNPAGKHTCLDAPGRRARQAFVIVSRVLASLSIAISAVRASSGVVTGVANARRTGLGPSAVFADISNPYRSMPVMAAEVMSVALENALQ
jgi:hypothetical protein